MIFKKFFKFFIYILKLSFILVDSYNIMSYDFTSGNFGDAYSGHQTNTYVNT